MPETLKHSSEMLDPNTFSQVARLNTPAWRHKMNIKAYLKDETSVEVVDALCNYIISELDKIIEREKRWQDKAPGETHYYVGKLEDLKADFDVLIDSNDMSVSDLEDEFNYRLDDLYDLADTKIRLKDGSLQKFLWVGAV